MTEPTSNPHADAARLRKAFKLADAARLAKMTALEARDAGTGQTSIIARIAGVGTPSDETWAIVVEILENGEALARRLGEAPRLRELSPEEAPDLADATEIAVAGYNAPAAPCCRFHDSGGARDLVCEDESTGRMHSSYREPQADPNDGHPIKCETCGAVAASVDLAIDDGWAPEFEQLDGTDAGPVCAACIKRLGLVCDDDGFARHATPAERLDRALDAAGDAFWAAIAAAYPEAKTGDLSLEASRALGFAERTALGEWIGRNVPRETEAAVVPETSADHVCDRCRSDGPNHCPEMQALLEREDDDDASQRCESPR